MIRNRRQRSIHCAASNKNFPPTSSGLLFLSEISVFSQSRSVLNLRFLCLRSSGTSETLRGCIDLKSPRLAARCAEVSAPCRRLLIRHNGSQVIDINAWVERNSSQRVGLIKLQDPQILHIYASGLSEGVRCRCCIVLVRPGDCRVVQPSASTAVIPPSPIVDPAIGNYNGDHENLRGLSHILCGSDRQGIRADAVV